MELDVDGGWFRADHVYDYDKDGLLEANDSTYLCLFHHIFGTLTRVSIRDVFCSYNRKWGILSDAAKGSDQVCVPSAESRVVPEQPYLQERDHTAAGASPCHIRVLSSEYDELRHPHFAKNATRIATVCRNSISVSLSCFRASSHVTNHITNVSAPETFITYPH
jgi:hypothetical protein